MLKHTFKSIQFDSADATLVQASNWNSEHIPDADGIKMTVGTTDPAAPASGFVNVYAKDIATRALPKWMDPDGMDYHFQASLGYNRVTKMVPIGGTAATTLVAVQGPIGGSGVTALANTYASPTLAATNLKTSMRRATIATAASAGQAAYIRPNALECWMGDAAGLGGFFFTARFAQEATAGGSCHIFVGLVDSIASPASSVNILTATTPGRVGVAVFGGHWNAQSTLTGTAPTNTDLGASFNLNTTDVLEVSIFCAPNGSTIGYRLKNLTTGAVATGTYGANIPANTTFLAPAIYLWNDTTSSLVSTVATMGWYLESDD